MYAQRRVFQRAGEAGIKVMLDGQGADELLGGYHYFIAARLGSLLRKGRFAAAVRLFWNASRLSAVGASWLWLRAMDFVLPSNLQVPLRRWVEKDLMPSWLNSKWFAENGVEARSPSYSGARDVLREALYHALTETSLPGLLRYEDRNSMAFSIESRVPFLTPSLVNFALALPEQYIIGPDGTTKAVFRRAMRGIVPDAVLDRRDKIGFATPEKDWLFVLRPWVGRVLASESAMQIPAMDVKEIQREWDRILRRGRPFDFRVWRWVNMIVWVEKLGVSIE
jgi:asparagine synthase (glutamine-hydrolysing)